MYLIFLHVCVNHQKENEDPKRLLGSKYFYTKNGQLLAGHWWLIAVILATQEAEIRRIMVQSQPGQIVHETSSQSKPSQKMAGGVAQGVGPEVKPQY
jgi:hypothetical protein